jgi:hypothetical protein
MTQKQSQPSSSSGDQPRSGEKYHCGKCGVEVEVTQEATSGQPHMECCGQPLAKNA